MDIASSLANAGNGQHDRSVSCHSSEATARVAAVILYPSLGCPLVLAPGQTRARLVIGVNASDSRRFAVEATTGLCLLYTSPSPRDLSTSRMPSSA